MLVSTWCPFQMWMNVSKRISDSSVKEKELYVTIATDHTIVNVNKDFAWTCTSNTVLVRCFVGNRLTRGARAGAQTSNEKAKLPDLL